MNYSAQTVSQLKELLKTRDLSTSGLKGELVARLEEADKTVTAGTTAEQPAPQQEELLEETKEEQVETTAVEPTVAIKTTETTETIETNETTEAKEETVEEPKVKILSPEERKAGALELLNKKLARAKKFGTEDDAESVKRDIARVEKFGVETGTSLAKELGLISKEGLSEEKRGRRGSHSHRRNNRPRTRK